jgi:hypothetical protein
MDVLTVVLYLKEDLADSKYSDLTGTVPLKC